MSEIRRKSIVRPLTWHETHGGMWLRAEGLGFVCEIPARDPDLEAKKAGAEMRYERSVLDVLDVLDLDGPENMP